MDLLKLLEEEKVKEFNAARGMGMRIDLFAADLADKNLAGVNLTGVNLQKADLSGTNLTGADITQTDFSGADLTGAILKEVSGMRSRWRDAYLGEADLSDADLAGADMTDADVSDGTMARAMLTGAKLKRAILVKTDLSAADLAEARISDADLKHANFKGAQLREANLSRSDLSHTQLSASDLTRAKLAGATLEATDLSNACLNSADLTAAVLTKTVISGADFTRADFTDAEISDVDLANATMTDAQIDGKLAGSAVEDAGIAAVQVEDPKLATNGNRIAFIWENPDSQGRPSIRIANGTGGSKWNGKLGLLPVPADLVVSSSFVPFEDGFMAVTLLDRPGGAIVNFTPVAKNGKIGESKSVKLGYTPVVRPEVRSEDGNIFLYGISRHGPTVRVDQLTDEGLQPVFGKSMPTARGFVAGARPHVLSKGGVLVPVSTKSMGEPMRVPSSFPGRAQMAAPVTGGLALAWIPSSGKGFRFCIARPGTAPEETVILPKQEIGTLTMMSNGDEAWVVFTRQAPEPRDPTQAWAVLLPDGTPFPLYEGDDDASSLHFADGCPGDSPTIGVTTFEGSFEVYALGKRGAKHKFHIA